MSQPRVRIATIEDIAAINEIASRSVRFFHRSHHDDITIEEGVREIYGTDWQLVRDGSYFVAEISGVIAGAGGWSFRETIGGAHGPDEPPSSPLDPSRDPARIRAFYIDPPYARQGLARALLKFSEDAARQTGFTSAELTATLPSVAAWASLGYLTLRDYRMTMPSGAVLQQKLMRKDLLIDPAST